MAISMIGLDTAKAVFQVHGVDETGRAALKRKLRRNELVAFFGCDVSEGGDVIGLAVAPSAVVDDHRQPERHRREAFRFLLRHTA